MSGHDGNRGGDPASLADLVRRDVTTHAGSLR